MKFPGYYTSGEFAQMAQVSVRTIRFYDKQNILKPSLVNDSGFRLYTDEDFTRLQQILLFKYLGFSLDDIREMTMPDVDYRALLSSLNLQKRLIQDRIEQMQLVETAIGDTVEALEKNQKIEWKQMLDLIHLTGMEQSLKSQYQNANNISARIRLHSEFSHNSQGWFPWLFSQCSLEGKNVLELGCGSGALWLENLSAIPSNTSITLSDISEGMIRDVRRQLQNSDIPFSYATFDCHQIPFEDESFDIVFANHVLFYCEDIPQVCQEIRRVLKPTGLFICSTYGSAHMKEITELVQSFDSRITLSKECLYERFGLENGESILSHYFSQISCNHYEDYISLDQGEPLIEYILSCHGNQNQYILDRYHDFQIFVEKKVKKDFHITKDAGCFLCKK